MNKPTSINQHIHQIIGRLRKSERKVAEYVLANPQDIIHLRVIDLANKADVSEPTVIRFCHAIGCHGFQDLKLTLAQQLTSTPSFGQVAVDDNDSTSELSQKVFDGTIDILQDIHNHLDNERLDQAIAAISSANRVEFFGFGASGTVAQDAYHKFFRLQLAAAAHCDHHLQNMSAASMAAGDVVVAISHSGSSRALLDAVALANEAGATTISLCPAETPLAELAEIPLIVNVQENIELYTPMFSRIAHLVVIDVLAIGVAQQKGGDLKAHLFKLKQGLKNLKHPITND